VTFSQEPALPLPDDPVVVHLESGSAILVLFDASLKPAIGRVRRFARSASAAIPRGLMSAGSRVL
jgi:hypothetical protein